MAEPTNTPMPASTPVPASTPRSSSPAPPVPVPMPSAAHFAGLSSPTRDRTTTHLSSAIASSSATAAPSPATSGPRLRVLHIGDECRYNPATYAAFSAQFDVVRPSAAERERDAFKAALRERRWGDFAAIFRPFWGTGGEMGRWDAELIGLLPASVKVFASAGAGFDWADTKLLGERGIIYCNSGLAAAEAVADFAVAMIISTFRHIPWCLSAAATSSSDSGAAFRECHQRATAQSHNLSGRIVGLIGLGNIGQQIARRCGAGFGMRIHYHDVIRKPDVERALGAVFHDSLQGLLGVSECAVLCTPAGNGRLITAKELGWLPRGARFVNVARGSLVDEEALADALDCELLSAVALDVFDTEPVISPRLLKYAGSRAMLSCHNAGGTVETHIGFEELSMRNIMAVLSGRPPITPVNLEFLKAD